MSNIRAISGSTRISNRPSGGGSKKAGIPSSTNISMWTHVGFRNRDATCACNPGFISCTNQLGGIGKGKSQFGPSADGVQCNKNCLPSNFNISIPSGAVANNNSATTLVLACIDPRFISALESYLYKKIISQGFSYDLYILAGASLGGNNANHNFPNWRTTLDEHINVALALHNIEKIEIYDHKNCGAYIHFNGGNDSIMGHEHQLEELRNYIMNTSYLYDPNAAPHQFVAADINTFIISIDGCFNESPVTGQQAGLCEYIPPSSGAKVLVLGCIDPRFQAILTSFLVNYKDVEFIYDLFILAGASLGVNQSYINFNPNSIEHTRGVGNTMNYPSNQIPQWGDKWGPTFFQHLGIAIQLHNITEVWVFDHLDCGAYKLIKFGSASATDNEIEPHRVELNKLKDKINMYKPKLGYNGYVVDMAGNVKKVSTNNKGTCK